MKLTSQDLHGLGDFLNDLSGLAERHEVWVDTAQLRLTRNDQQFDLTTVEGRYAIEINPDCVNYI